MEKICYYGRKKETVPAIELAMWFNHQLGHVLGRSTEQCCTRKIIVNTDDSTS